jgi:hypothetical protein
MIARCVYLEGSIEDSRKKEFEKFLIDEIVPLMKRFPGVLAVRVMTALQVEDEGRNLCISFESMYPDLATMEFAFTQPIRGMLKKKLSEIIPLFHGRMFHITQNVLVEECLGT